MTKPKVAHHAQVCLGGSLPLQLFLGGIKCRTGFNIFYWHGSPHDSFLQQTELSWQLLLCSSKKQKWNRNHPECLARHIQLNYDWVTDRCILEFRDESKRNWSHWRHECMPMWHAGWCSLQLSLWTMMTKLTRASRIDKKEKHKLLQKTTLPTGECFIMSGVRPAPNTWDHKEKRAWTRGLVLKEWRCNCFWCWREKAGESWGLFMCKGSCHWVICNDSVQENTKENESNNFHSAHKHASIAITGCFWKTHTRCYCIIVYKKCGKK